MTTAPPAPALDLHKHPTAAPPVWPAVIGTLSIGFGVLGILQSASGALMTAWSAGVAAGTGKTLPPC